MPSHSLTTTTIYNRLVAPSVHLYNTYLLTVHRLHVITCLFHFQNTIYIIYITRSRLGPIMELITINSAQFFVVFKSAYVCGYWL